VRGGLLIVAGTLAGNVLGVVRVAVTAYLLGTHSRADSLAVAIGPMDALNAVLINSMVFAFVPMLAAREAAGRVALFLELRRCFRWVFSAVALAVIVAGEPLARILAPGLDAQYFPAAVMNLRILALSSPAAGIAALHCSVLYTERRFGPTIFYSAALNLGTAIGALALWRMLGVYAFAIGYSAGAWTQLAIVSIASRPFVGGRSAPACEVHWRDLLVKPVFFLIYAAGLAVNITFTRAYATQAGPGMAAAIDYCMRGVSVPLALIVNPVTNSLLPEIARLRNLLRLREAFRLIDRTMALAALAVAAGCGFAILFRRPVIALLFQHGSFTADSTQLVSAVFLGLAPCIVGWSLIEIACRSLFALDRPWLPVLASFLPLLFNAIFTLRLRNLQPEWIGAGASLGLLAGFAMLFSVLRLHRRRWLEQS
jgi:putative peptidoglycan lipid II flippase